MPTLRTNVLLAVVLVLATMGAVAVIAHLIIGLPWAAAFVLGAILAPTDPVAAEAIFGRLDAPERVGTIIGGESLVNDGTGLAAFRVAVVVSGAFSVWGRARASCWSAGEDCSSASSEALVA